MTEFLLGANRALLGWLRVGLLLGCWGCAMGATIDATGTWTTTATLPGCGVEQGTLTIGYANGIFTGKYASPDKLTATCTHTGPYTISDWGWGTNIGTASQMVTEEQLRQGLSDFFNVTFSSVTFTTANKVVATGALLGTTLTYDLVRSGSDTPARYTLTVSTDGSGYGAVASFDSGISCYAPVPGRNYLVAPDCTESYATGTIVKLNPKPEAGSVFVGWSGACSGTGSCFVPIDDNKSVKAAFKVAPFAVTTTGVTDGVITAAIATVSSKIDIAPADLTKRGAIYLTAWIPVKGLGTVLPFASSNTFKDDFSNGLTAWVNRGGNWTASNGKLTVDYDIGCASVTCPHADLTLADSYQLAGDYEAVIDFSKTTDPRGYAWSVAQFGLWSSANQKISIGIGGGGNLTWGGPQSTISVDVQNWSGTWSARLPKASFNYAWNADKTQTASIRKAGKIYSIYINGTYLTQFTDDFLSGTGKLGLHAYGPKVYDNFRLRPPGTSETDTVVSSAAGRMFSMPASAVAATPSATYALVQWTPSGWAQVENGKLTTYVSGVLGDLNSSQTILNNTDTTQLPGAQFCLGYGTTAEEMIAAGNLQLVASIPDPSGSSDSAGSCLVVNGLNYRLAVQKGWNLLGNGLAKTQLVATLWGDISTVSSAWKWDPVGQKWLFYTPSMDASTLQSYAAGMGYGVLGEIKAGDGYWVNALVPATLDMQSGTPFELPGSSLLPGWNLVSTGTAVTPSAMHAAGTAFASAWTWDSALSQWYFYSPTLEAQGSSALTNYVNSKNYKEFGTSKTVGSGVGFWVLR